PPAQIGQRGDPPRPRRLDQLSPPPIGRISGHDLAGGAGSVRIGWLPGRFVQVTGVATDVPGWTAVLPLVPVLPLALVLPLVPVLPLALVLPLAPVLPFALV